MLYIQPCETLQCSTISDTPFIPGVGVHHDVRMLVDHQEMFRLLDDPQLEIFLCNLLLSVELGVDEDRQPKEELATKITIFQSLPLRMKKIP